MTHDKARVIPFEQLAHDRRRRGRRQERIARRDDQPARRGRHSGSRAGSRRPPSAFREFLEHDGLAQRIADRLRGLDIDDVAALARGGRGDPRLAGRGAAAAGAGAGNPRRVRARWPRTRPDASFAVRSSATAEDLPDASFAGQQETFLNINGLDNIIHAIREVFASLYNDRAIAYRVHKGFAHADVALSAGVQRMVRSDLGASGVMFTLDTESGFDKVVFITSAYGLGETVVQGAVNPDEFYVDKRNLAAGRPAILRKTVGGKAHQDDVHRRAHGRQVDGDGRRAGGRPPALLDHRRRGRGTGPRRRGHRAALRRARWTSNGAATATTASSTSCRRGRRR